MESMKALNPGGIQEDYDEILILNEEIRIDVSYTYDADGLKVKYDSFFTSNNFLGFLSEEDAVDNQFIRDEIEANELAP